MHTVNDSIMNSAVPAPHRKRQVLASAGIMAAVLLLWVHPAWSALRVGMPIGFPPFSYQAEGEDRVRGYSVDVIETLGNVMDEEAQFLVGDPDDLLTALAENRIDMICGVVLSEQIRQAYDYLEISVFVKRFFYVNQEGVDPIRQKSLAGKTVVVVRGQPYMDQGFHREGVNIIQARDVLEALRMLDKNQAQVFVGMSERVVKYLVSEFGLNHIRQVGVTMGQFPLAIIVPKGNTALLKNLSMGLGMAISDGTLGRVQDKWFGGRAWEHLWMQYRLYVWLLGGIFLAGLGAVIAWNQALKRKVSRVTRDLGISEQRYRDVIESSPDMVLVINEKGDIRLVNASARRKLGRFEDTLSRAPLQSIIEGESRPPVDRFLAQLFTGGDASAEMRLSAAAGNIVSVEIAAARIQHGSGGEPVACCFARDLTRRKKMEAELIQAERLATIGKMAASIAHEINNPIGIVLAHTEDLMSGELASDEFQDSLAVIQRNAVRAGHITETLLAQACQNPEPHSPTFQTIIDLAGLLEECIHFIRPRLKKIHLEKELPPVRFHAEGDAGGLQQVFINLLLNAVESIDGTGVIRIWLAAEKDGPVPVTAVVVEDSGRGIAEADCDKIFEPFFTRGKQRGFGLGLFVARTIAARHGGDIRCEAARGGGTRMIVRIPQADANTDRTREFEDER